MMIYSFSDFVAGSGPRKKLSNKMGYYKEASGATVSLLSDVIEPSHGNKGASLDPRIDISNAEPVTQQTLRDFAATPHFSALGGKFVQITDGPRKGNEALKFPPLTFAKKPVKLKSGESQAEFLARLQEFNAENDRKLKLFTHALDLLDPVTARVVTADLDTIKNAFRVNGI